MRALAIATAALSAAVLATTGVMWLTTNPDHDTATCTPGMTTHLTGVQE